MAMFFFKDYKNDLIDNGLTPFGNSSVVSLKKLRSFYNALKGEDDSRAMRCLSALAVLLLHAWVLLWLKEPVEPVTEAKPLIMEVSMVAIPKPVSVAPSPATPPPVKKPDPPKKSKPKPLPKKKTPLVEKKPELPKAEPKIDNSPAPAVQPAMHSTPSAAATSAVAKAPVAETPKFTEANFRANYGFNPKPEYPRLARNRGWEGKVLLKVQVSDKGFSLAVDVHQSSGHDVLDESAVEAVKKWKFIPAKRGETDVASSVIVPIIFKLDHS